MFSPKRVSNLGCLTVLLFIHSVATAMSPYGNDKSCKIFCSRQPQISHLHLCHKHNVQENTCNCTGTNWPQVTTIQYTQWQRPLSGVQSIMMEKLAQAGEGEGGGARPPPFTVSTITYKVEEYAPAERADSLPIFLLYPDMYLW